MEVYLKSVGELAEEYVLAVNTIVSIVDRSEFTKYRVGKCTYQDGVTFRKLLEKWIEKKKRKNGIKTAQIRRERKEKEIKIADVFRKAVHNTDGTRGSNCFYR